MVDDLHKNHFHLMISVWPFFEPGSAAYDEMDKRGWFIDQTKSRRLPHSGMAVYDATNPEARAYYWSPMDKALFHIGVDAWWLDTTEPETEGQEENILLHHKLAIGSGDRYANLFPLMTTAAVYEGQRGAIRHASGFSSSPARHSRAASATRLRRGPATSSPTSQLTAADPRRA